MKGRTFSQILRNGDKGRRKNNTTYSAPSPKSLQQKLNNKLGEQMLKEHKHIAWALNTYMNQFKHERTSK